MQYLPALQIPVSLFPLVGWQKIMLDVNGLSFDYCQTPVLKEVNFSLQPGEIMHIKGQNGAGKTTLLKLLAGLLLPLEGNICFFKQSIYPNLASYQQNLCFIGHKAGFNAGLTVRENCYFDLHWPHCQHSLDYLLSLFGLSQLADMPCGLLSAGQRRRVALTRLAMNEKHKLWLLDEPLTALDNSALHQLMTLFNHQLQRGGMIVLTSHQALPQPLAQVKEYTLE